MVDRGELGKNKQAQWWVAFILDPSARPPQPQGVLSAGWSEVSPIFEPTAQETEALCVFTTDYGATAYMHSLSAQQGGSHPIITEGINSHQDLEQIAVRRSALSWCSGAHTALEHIPFPHRGV
jgi:hypothetical protein